MPRCCGEWSVLLLSPFHVRPSSPQSLTSCSPFHSRPCSSLWPRCDQTAWFCSHAHISFLVNKLSLLSENTAVQGGGGGAGDALLWNRQGSAGSIHKQAHGSCFPAELCWDSEADMLPLCVVLKGSAGSLSGPAATVTYCAPL